MKAVIYLSVFLLSIFFVSAIEVYQGVADRFSYDSSQDYSMMVDGDWLTAGIFSTAYPINLTFNKQSGYVGSMIIAGFASMDYYSNVSVVIPDDCWNYDSNKVFLRTRGMYGDESWSGGTAVDCMSSSGWLKIIHQASDDCCPRFDLTELAMVWDKPVVGLPLINLRRVGNYFEYFPKRIITLINLFKSKISIEKIATTSGGNNIFFLSYGRVTDKRVVFISRQHGGESAASFMAEGFFIKSLNDLSYTKMLRTYFVPMVNPDGAAKDSANNLAGQNTNRFWDKNSCFETKKVRDRIKSTNISNIDMVIDQHALNGGEMISEIIISSKYNLQSENICLKASKYLPGFKCSVTRCPSTSETVRGYYCNKDVRYNILIDVAQFNKTYTPEKVYHLGEGLEGFVKEVLLS